MGTGKFSSRITAVALGAFAAVFVALAVGIVFFNTLFGYKAALQLPLLAMWCALVCMVIWQADKRRTWVVNNRYRILLCVLLLVFAVQLYVGAVTTQTPDHDYGKVYNGALIFAAQGDGAAFAEYKSYLHHFTNNVPPFLLLQALFKGITELGLSCHYEVTMVIGHLLFTAAIAFTFFYLERSFGRGAALASLLLWVAFLPVYAQSSIAYTDTLSIWAPPLALWLHAVAKATPRKGKKAALYLLLGLCLGLGGQIKATVLIVGIAIVIEFLLAGPKRSVLPILCIAFGVFVMSFTFNAWANATVRDPARADEAMPITFWPMMGLTGDGSYNAYDEWVVNTQVFGKTARTQLHLQVIGERLQEMGVSGYLQFLPRKAMRTFGCGNGEVYYLLVRAPQNPNHWIYRVISSEGDLFRYFNNFSQCIYLSFYVFAVGGVMALVKNKAARSHYTANTAPFVALLGFVLFMLIWEANHRQLVNQWPLFIIIAAAGLATLAQAVQSKHSSV